MNMIDILGGAANARIATVPVPLGAIFNALINDWLAWVIVLMILANAVFRLFIAIKQRTFSLARVFDFVRDHLLPSLVSYLLIWIIFALVGAEAVSGAYGGWLAAKYLLGLISKAAELSDDVPAWLVGLSSWQGQIDKRIADAMGAK